MLHHWSRTQRIISLGSADAELNAICKGAQEGLGAKHMSEEFQNIVGLTLKTDASATRGVVQRQGAGNVNHLSVKQLWVQEHKGKKELKIAKVPR